MKKGYTLALSADSKTPVKVTISAPGCVPATYTLKPGQELRPLLKEKR